MPRRGRRVGLKGSANSFVGPITIDSISINSSGTSATIYFTHNFRGKNSLTYQATTSGASSSVGTSPLTINGLIPGTSYSFTVVASSAAGVINSSSTTSGAIVVDQQAYSLSQTFLSSGVFTVPANVTEIAVKGIGAGGNGANGLGPDGGSGSAGGRGGGGGGGFIFKNYSVTPGQTYNVTIGSSGQATSFGSLATANSGTSSSGGGVSSTVTLEVSANGPTGGAGGSGGSYSYSFGTPSAGQSGSNGSGGTTLTSTAPGVGSITLGGSGGGGGGGAVGSTNGPASGGLGGSGSGGGSGGNGGSAAQPGSGGGTSGGSNGTSSSSRGAGGGGGGGGSLSRDSGTGGGVATSGGSGGSGQPGAIYVYTRIPATYAISPSTTSLNEGSSVTFNITTTNFGSGTLYWTLEGVSGTINDSDFSSPANAVTSGGSVSITNNSGSFSVTLNNDSSTEGTESFLARLRVGSTSGATVASSSTISVGDTSVTPYYNPYYNPYNNPPPYDNTYYNPYNNPPPYDNTYYNPYNNPPPYDNPYYNPYYNPPSGGGGGCFVFGTQILMADGTYKNMEDLQIGDQICGASIPTLPDEEYPNYVDQWSISETSGIEKITSTVTGKMYDMFNSYFRINNLINVTFEHLVLAKSPDTDWRFVAISALNIGDSILDDNMQETIVSSKEEIFEQVQTINIDTEPKDVYFVKGMLAHNIICADCAGKV